VRDNAFVHAFRYFSTVLTACRHDVESESKRQERESSAFPANICEFLMRIEHGLASRDVADEQNYKDAEEDERRSHVS
jgi:hypothetical protein